ncbi:MAG: MFS transporter, partial [Promethearchaeota archaeon]
EQKMVFILPFIGDFSNSVLNFLFVVIGVSYGFSPTQIGLILAAYGMTYVVMPALLGQISDKITHKISLLISVIGQIILSVVLILILSFFSSSSVIFYSIFIEQLLRGFFYSLYWPVIQAYLSEKGEYSYKVHKKIINNFCIAWGLGMAIGPLIGGIISEIEIMVGFWAVLISHIVALFIVLTKIQKSTNKSKNLNSVKSLDNENLSTISSISDTTVNSENSKKLDHSINGVNLKKVNIFLFAIALIFALNSKVLIYYFPNYALLPDGLGWSESLTGEIMLTFGIGQLIFFILGRFFKNTFKAILSSIFILSCLLFLLYWVKNWIIIGLILFFIGLLVGRLYYVSLELLMIYEKKDKGKKAGFFESFIGLGVIISPLIAGVLAEISLTLPFMFFSVFTVSIFIILSIFKQTF